MTERVQRLIARQLEDRIRVALTPSDVMQALQDLDANQRGKLMEAIRANSNDAGRLFLSAVSALVRERATVQAQDYLADGSLSSADLIDIFGP